MTLIGETSPQCVVSVAFLVMVTIGRRVRHLRARRTPSSGSNTLLPRCNRLLTRPFPSISGRFHQKRAGAKVRDACRDMAWQAVRAGGHAAPLRTLRRSFRVV